MRKILTVSILILLFSGLAGSVFAGQGDDVCGDFKGKDKQGLYGLCKAYQNAYNSGDAEAMADLFANWLKKTGGDGSDLPNAPIEDAVVCPCWTAETLDQATAGKFGSFCVSSEVWDEAYYANNDPYLFAGFDGFAPTSRCVLQAPGVSISILNLTPEEEEVCRAGVQTMQESVYTDDFGNEFPVFPPCLEF